MESPIAIRLFLTSRVAFNISREKKIQGLMAALSKIYEKPSASNKAFLMKKLINLKMAESESVTEHLNEFNTLTSQLESVKINFVDEIKVLVLLFQYTRDLRWSHDDSEQLLWSRNLEV